MVAAVVGVDQVVILVVAAVVGVDQVAVGNHERVVQKVLKSSCIKLSKIFALFPDSSEAFIGEKQEQSF
jgi:hypothetical protein